MLVLMMDVQLTLVIMKDVKPLMLTVMITMLVSRGCQYQQVDCIDYDENLTTENPQPYLMKC